MNETDRPALGDISDILRQLLPEDDAHELVVDLEILLAQDADTSAVAEDWLRHARND